MTELIRRDVGEVDAPVLLAQARAALAEADTLPDISGLIARAEVIRVAARKAELSRDAQNDWAEYKLDAERKAGALLREMEKAPGTRGQLVGPGVVGDRASRQPMPDAPSLSDLGISRDQSSRWQRIASLPEDQYQAYKSDARAKGEVTEAGAIRVAKHREKVEQQRATAKARQQERAKPAAATIEQAACLDWLPATPPADLLLTDPPYSTDVDDVHAFAHEWLPAALARVKPSGRAYVCIGAYPDELLAYLSAPRGGMVLADILVWTYRNTIGPSSKYDYSLNWQAILHYRGPDAPPLRTDSLVERFAVIDMNAPDGRRGERWHTWQKPDELGERLVEHATEPGATVIDPFAGTGTFLLAAARLGRLARGADRDPDMVAIAKERGCE
ncbi:MAG: site-specific DNA-methyltransferase [Acidimicrobiia bacterium]